MRAPRGMVLAAALLLSAGRAAAAADCPCLAGCDAATQYERAAALCFRQYPVPGLSWDAAQLECARDGGYLVEDAGYLAGYAGRTDIWTGARVQGAVMVWAEGGGAVDAALQSVPGGHGDGACGLFHHPTVYRYYCHAAVGYVCEKPVVAFDTHHAEFTAAAAGAGAAVAVSGTGPIDRLLFFWATASEGCGTAHVAAAADFRDGAVAVPSAVEGPTAAADLQLCWFGPLPAAEAARAAVLDSYQNAVPTTAAPVTAAVAAPPAVAADQMVAVSAAALPKEVELLGTDLAADAVVALFTTPTCDGTPGLVAASGTFTLPVLPTGVYYACAAAWVTAVPVDPALAAWRPGVNATIEVLPSPVFAPGRTALPFIASVVGGEADVAAEHVPAAMQVQWCLSDACDTPAIAALDPMVPAWDEAQRAVVPVPPGVPTGRPLVLCYTLDNRWRATPVTAQVTPPPDLPRNPTPTRLEVSYPTAVAGATVTFTARNLYTQRAPHSGLYLLLAGSAGGCDAAAAAAASLRPEDEVIGTSITGTAVVASATPGAHWLCVVAAAAPDATSRVAFETHIQFVVGDRPAFTPALHVLAGSGAAMLPAPEVVSGAEASELVYGLSQTGCTAPPGVVKTGGVPTVNFPAVDAAEWQLCWGAAGADGGVEEWFAAGVAYQLLPEARLELPPGGAEGPFAVLPYGAYGEGTSAALHGAFLVEADVYWMALPGRCAEASVEDAVAHAHTSCAPYCASLDVPIPPHLGDAAQLARYAACVALPGAAAWRDAAIHVDIVPPPRAAPRRVDVSLHAFYAQVPGPACAAVADTTPALTDTRDAQGYCLPAALIDGIAGLSRFVHVAAVPGAGSDCIAAGPAVWTPTGSHSHLPLHDLRPGASVTLCFSMGMDAPVSAWAPLNVTVAVPPRPALPAAVHRPSAEDVWGRAPYAVPVAPHEDMQLYFAWCAAAAALTECSAWRPAEDGAVPLPHHTAAAHSNTTRALCYALTAAVEDAPRTAVATGIRVDLPLLVPLAPSDPIVLDYAGAQAGLQLPMFPGAVDVDGLKGALRQGAEAGLVWVPIGPDGSFRPGMGEVGAGAAHELVVTWGGATDRPLPTGVTVAWYGRPAVDPVDVSVTLGDLLLTGVRVPITGRFIDRGVALRVGCPPEPSPHALPARPVAGGVVEFPLPPDGAVPGAAAAYPLCWAPVGAGGADWALGGPLRNATVRFPSVPEVGATEVVVPRLVHLGVDAAGPPYDGEGVAFAFQGRFLPTPEEPPLALFLGCDPSAALPYRGGRYALPYALVAASRNATLCWSAGEGHMAPFPPPSRVVWEPLPDPGVARDAAITPAHYQAAPHAAPAGDLFPGAALDGVYAVWVRDGGDCATGAGVVDPVAVPAAELALAEAALPMPPTGRLRVCYAVVKVWAEDDAPAPEGSWLRLPSGTAGAVLAAPQLHPTYTATLSGFPQVAAVSGRAVVGGAVNVTYAAADGSEAVTVEGGAVAAGVFLVGATCALDTGAVVPTEGAPVAALLALDRSGREAVAWAGVLCLSMSGRDGTFHEVVQLWIHLPAHSPAPTSPTPPPETTAPPTPMPPTAHPQTPSPPTSNPPTPSPPTPSPPTPSPPTPIPFTAVPIPNTSAPESQRPCPSVATLGVLASMSCFGSLNEAGRLVGCLRSGGVSKVCLAQYDRCVSELVGRCPPYEVEYHDVSSPITVVFGMDVAEFDASLFAAALAGYVEVIPWLVEVTAVAAGSAVVEFRLRGPPDDIARRVEYLEGRLAARENPWALYSWTLAEGRTNVSKSELSTPVPTPAKGTSAGEIALAAVTAGGVALMLLLGAALWMSRRRAGALEVEVAAMEVLRLAVPAVPSGGSEPTAFATPARSTPSALAGGRAASAASPMSALRSAGASIRRLMQRVTQSPPRPHLTDIMAVPTGRHSPAIDIPAPSATADLSAELRGYQPDLHPSAYQPRREDPVVVEAKELAARRMVPQHLPEWEHAPLPAP